MALFPLVKTAQKTVRKKANSIRELTDWDEELVLLEDAPSGPIELVKDGRKWKFKAFDFGEGLGIL